MFPIKISKNEYKNIVNKYKDGKLPKDIAKGYNVTVSTIRRILNNNGIKLQNVTSKIDKHIIINIIQKYQDGLSTTELGIHFGFCASSIGKILRENNIILREGSQSQRKYQIRKKYFDQIDIEAKAYFLGLLYADGCNKLDTITISLQEEDKYILENFANELYSNYRPLYYEPRVKGKDTYRLTIASKTMCNKLCMHGMLPNKSLILKPPTTVPNELFWHFVRGYFDGDGCVNLNKNNKQIKFEILGTELVLQWILDGINLRLNESIKGHIYNCGKKGITKRLILNKKELIDKINNCLYNNANFYLTRKKYKFDYFFELNSYKGVD